MDSRVCQCVCVCVSLCLSVCMSLVLLFGFFFCLLFLSYSDLCAFVSFDYSLDICLLMRERRAVDSDGRGGGSWRSWGAMEIRIYYMKKNPFALKR